MRSIVFSILLLAGILFPFALYTQVSNSNQEAFEPHMGINLEKTNHDSLCEIDWQNLLSGWELSYDDGEPEDFALWAEPGSSNAVKFSPGWTDPYYIPGGRIFVGDGSFPGPFIGTEFKMAIYDDDGPDNMPGSILDTIQVTVENYGWVEFYFPAPLTVVTDGDFFLGMIQTLGAPDAAPVGVDVDLPTYQMSYSRYQQQDWQISAYQDMMIRSYTSRDSIAIPSVDHYILDRFSDFDINFSPDLGNCTHLTVTTETSFDDSTWNDLPNGWYAYGIRVCYNEDDTSDYYFSSVVYKCNPPLNVTSETNPSNGCVELSWKPPAPDSTFQGHIQQYSIYRSDNGDEFEFLADVDSSVHDYCDDLVESYQCYRVVATYSTGWGSCISRQSDETCEYLNIQDIQGEEAVECFPNPAGEKLVIRSPQVIKSVILYDQQGRIRFSTHNDSKEIHLQLTGYPSALYFLEIRTDEEVMYRKVIVSR